MTQERGRSRGGRSRSSEDPLPSPDAFDAEIHELVLRAKVVAKRYRRDYVSGLEGHGSSGLHIQGGASNPTEEAWESEMQEAIREDCRRSVKWVREAASDITKAVQALGADKGQPREPSPDAVIDKAQFREHVKREREERR